MMHALDPAVHGPIFETIEDLLPTPKPHPLGCHRGRVPDQACFAALLFRLVTGASWTTIEALLPWRVSDTTLRARRDEWIEAGVFDEIARQALAGYQRLIGLRLEHVSIDESTNWPPAAAKTQVTGSNNTAGSAGNGASPSTTTASQSPSPSPTRTATTTR